MIYEFKIHNYLCQSNPIGEHGGLYDTPELEAKTTVAKTTAIKADKENKKK